MNLKCPNCFNRSLPILKILIADCFGWAVRCTSCQKRVSHFKWTRSVIAVLVWFGFSFAFVFGIVPDQRFHGIQFVISVFCVLIILVMVAVIFPLSEREEVVDNVIKQGVRKAFIGISGISGILIAARIYLFGVDKLGEFLLGACPT